MFTPRGSDPRGANIEYRQSAIGPRNVTVARSRRFSSLRVDSLERHKAHADIANVGGLYGWEAVRAAWLTRTRFDGFGRSRSRRNPDMTHRFAGQVSVAIVVVGLAAAGTSGQETLPPSGQSRAVRSGSAAQNTYYQLPQPPAGGYRIQPAREPVGFYGNDPRFDGRWDRGRPFPAAMRADGFVPPLNDTRKNVRPPHPQVRRETGASVSTQARQFATPPARPRLARLPSVQSETTAQRRVAEAVSEVGQPVDGTWREDADHIIINLDGRELKLAKTGPPSSRAGVPDLRLTAGGSVHGRLLHKGQAVVNCQVVIVPLTKNFGSYQVDGGGEPYSTLTDERGIYDFENVPKGRYKVFWLPEGSRQWVRRIEFRPDAVVKTGKAANVKDVRAALRTIN